MPPASARRSGAIVKTARTAFATAPPRENRAPLFTIGLLSATALAYEILLMRLFSIIQWHHFAYMIISLALLGYGASGTFLAITQSWLLDRYRSALLSQIALFAASTLTGFLLAQHIPFNPEQALWDPRQWLWLTVSYLLLMLPFFFAANAIALTLAQYRKSITRVYAFDLLGAGIGSVAIVLALFVLKPTALLTLITGLGIGCVAFATWELHSSGRVKVSLFAALLLVPVVWIGQHTDLMLSPYKDLSQTLRINGARVVATRSSPLGLLQVVDSPVVPLRYAPGMSVNASHEPPVQLGLFIDGDSAGVIINDTGARQPLAYLTQLTSALPYHLAVPKRVLVLGAGGGADVQQARFYGSTRIDAVELNPQLINLVRHEYARFSGGLYDQPAIQVHTAEGRGFVLDHGGPYDLIQVALLDSSGASATGLRALSEDYLYTTEALRILIAALSDEGYLAITRWVRLPPRDTLKIFATAIAALEALGVDEPAQHLILIRGWQTSTLLVKRSAIRAGGIKAVKEFAARRAFDVAYYPGIGPDEPNRYNVLRRAYFYEGARALLGTSHDTFLENYKFNIVPATDDRPYFYNYFKWSTLPEIWELRGRGGIPLLEAGYLVLVATLLQAIAASLFFIVLPLAFLKRGKRHGTAIVSRINVLTYFFAIGLAFLFLEIAFIQKFMLFLHHPVYAASVVLAAFLLFAGLGSRSAQKHADHNTQKNGSRRAVAGIVVLGLTYLFLLDTVFALLMAWPIVAKIAISVILIAPLAFCMGRPFPLALVSLSEHVPSLVPWAWGINGCASVLSAVLATLLAIHFGFTVVVVLALLLYALVTFVFPTAHRPGPAKGSENNFR